MKRVLVTGASGFIGSHLIAGLREKKCEIVVLERGAFSSSSLAQSVSGFDAIYHLAGICDSKSPNLFEVNVINTFRLFQAVVKNPTPWPVCVFVSSFAVYRPPQKGEVVTEKHPLDPGNDYGVSKLIAEQMLHGFADMGLRTSILRLSNVYGDGIPPLKHSVVATFMSKIVSGEEIGITGDGLQTRDFVFIDDVVNALIMAGERAPKRMDTINICSGEETQLIKMVRELENVTGLKAKINLTSGDTSSGNYWKGDYHKAQKILNWSPKFTLRRGLQELWRRGK